MKMQSLIFTALVALVVPAAASSGGMAYGVHIRGATVNRDRSVTIAWELERADVFNSWIAIDGSVVRTGSDRATLFTTRPLSRGSHTITIEVHEMFETYTPPGGAACRVSGGHWLCAQSWRSSSSVSVPYVANSCLVPRLVGLRLRAARTAIEDARCSLGSLKRVHSKRPAGTVLGQRLEPKRRLPEGTTIGLVISKGPRPTQ
jgi:hypothetical protein